MSEVSEYRLTPRQLGLTVAGTIFLGSVAAGFGIGTAIDEWNEDRDLSAPAVFAQELEVIESENDEIAHTLQNVKDGIPEQCEVLLDKYLAGNELDIQIQQGEEEEVSLSNIDQAVEDVLREPGQPCGDSVSDIRLEVTRLSDAHTASRDVSAQLITAKEKMNNLEENAKSNNRNEGAQTWVAVTGSVSAIFGGMFGYFASDDRNGSLTYGYGKMRNKQKKVS